MYNDISKKIESKINSELDKTKEIADKHRGMRTVINGNLQEIRRLNKENSGLKEENRR